MYHSFIVSINNFLGSDDEQTDYCFKVKNLQFRYSIPNSVSAYSIWILFYVLREGTKKRESN